MTSKTDYAYIAGILDGEGTICIANQLYLSVRFRNTNKLLLEWIQGIAGIGNIYCDNRNPSPCYSLDLTSGQAIRFLKVLMPYIRMKKAQARLAFKFQERMGKGRGLWGKGRPLTMAEKKKRQAFYWQMRELNHMRLFEDKATNDALRAKSKPLQTWL